MLLRFAMANSAGWRNYSKAVRWNQGKYGEPATEGILFGVSMVKNQVTHVRRALALHDLPGKISGVTRWPTG
jgi:hypothetical protein